MAGFIALLVVFGIPALIVVSSILRGWVLSILWGWFMVPVFHLPTLAIPQAIGVSLVLNFLRLEYRKMPRDQRWWESWAFMLGTYAWVLLIGYVVKNFI